MPHTIQLLSNKKPKIDRDNGNVKLGIIDKDVEKGIPIKAVAHSDGSHVVYVGEDFQDEVRILAIHQENDGIIGDLLDWVVDDMDNRELQFFNVVKPDVIENFDYTTFHKEEHQEEEMIVAYCYWEK